MATFHPKSSDTTPLSPTSTVTPDPEDTMTDSPTEAPDDSVPLGVIFGGVAGGTILGILLVVFVVVTACLVYILTDGKRSPRCQSEATERGKSEDIAISVHTQCLTVVLARELQLV